MNVKLVSCKFLKFNKIPNGIANLTLCTFLDKTSGAGGQQTLVIKSVKVLNSHSQKDRQLVFKTNYRLMQVKSIAECSPCFHYAAEFYEFENVW